jgi:glycosyltransferase involved in cell wall biosynthesis
MAKRIISFLKNNSLREKLGKLAIQRIKGNFTLAHRKKALRRIIGCLLK